MVSDRQDLEPHSPLNHWVPLSPAGNADMGTGPLKVSPGPTPQGLPTLPGLGLLCFQGACGQTNLPVMCTNRTCQWRARHKLFCPKTELYEWWQNLHTNFRKLWHSPGENRLPIQSICSEYFLEHLLCARQHNRITKAKASFLMDVKGFAPLLQISPYSRVGKRESRPRHPRPGVCRAPCWSSPVCGEAITECHRVLWEWYLQ